MFLFFLLSEDSDLNMLRFLQFFITLTACITAMIVIYNEKSYASFRCFSFIPYAIKVSLITLPYDKEFCFKCSGEDTYMRIDKLEAVSYTHLTLPTNREV